MCAKNLLAAMEKDTVSLGVFNDHDTTIFTVETPKKPSKSAKKSKKARVEKTLFGKCHWTVTNRAYFVEAVLEKVLGGDISTDSGFKSKDWTSISNDFSSKSGDFYSKQQLQSELASMKKAYAIMFRIRDNSGFGWDSENNVATAPDKVWNDYIEHNPLASKYRYGGWENYDAYCTIFDGQVATGKFSKSSNDQVAPKKKRQIREVAKHTDDDSDEESEESAGERVTMNTSVNSDEQMDATPRKSRGETVQHQALGVLKTLANKKSFCTASIEQLQRCGDFKNYAVADRVYLKTVMGEDRKGEVFCLMDAEEKEEYINELLAMKHTK